MEITDELAAVTRRIERIAAGPRFDGDARFENTVVQAIPAPRPGIERIIGAAAGQYGVDPALVEAVVANESGYDPNATSAAGARGLMQLMPGTAAALGRRRCVRRVAERSRGNPLPARIARPFRRRRTGRRRLQRRAERSCALRRRSTLFRNSQIRCKCDGGVSPSFSTRQRREHRQVTALRHDRTMTTQPLEVSILAAPLAAIDRRALSQAWYSALRLARCEHSGPPLSPARDLAPSVAPRLRVAPRASAPANAQQPISFRAPLLRSVSVEPPGEPVRPQRSIHLSARIEAAFAQRAQPPRRATFSLGRGGARVVVVLQTHGGRATLVALCRSEHRTLVASALAQARLALASRGIVLDLSTKGGTSCT